MSLTTKTLRDALLGIVTEFAESCEIQGLVSASNLAALVVSLANYHEEGQSLTPDVYLCNEIKDITQLLPGHDLINIGHSTESVKVLLESLKKCAPLAKGGWCIYVENKRSGKFNYGVFRSTLNPLAISLEGTLFPEPPLGEMSVVRICQTANGCVELRNTKGEICHLLLNDKPINSPPPNEHLHKLIEKISSRVNRKTKDATRNYLQTLIGNALNESHGALIAVLSNPEIPQFLQDGSILDSPLDFPAILTEFQKKNEQVNEHKLNSYKSLISGMISSDGIVVFDTKARLLAFNCFVQSPQQDQKVNGGARTRAYEALCTHVLNGELNTAFIRSQDGWTKLRSK